MLKELKVMDEPKKPEKPVSEGDSIIARTIFGIAFLIVGSIMFLKFLIRGRGYMATLFMALACMGYVLLDGNADVRKKNNEYRIKCRQYDMDLEKYNEQMKEYEQNKKDVRAYNFYAMCVNKGVDSDDQKGINLLAYNNGIRDYQQALELYKQGKEYARQYIEKENAEKKVKAYDNEKKKYNEIVAETRIYGKEKYIGALRKKLEATENLANLYFQATNLNISRSTQKAQTSDWALLGGLANGIAGSAAGMATAMDVQRKNAEAEAKAAVARQAASNDAAYFNQAAYNTNVEAAGYRVKIEEINKKIIDFSDEEEKLKMMDIEISEWKVLDLTHNMKIVLSIKCDKKVDLLNTKGVLDGSVKILIKKDGKIISDTYYSAPGFNETNMSKVGFGSITTGETLAIGPFEDNGNYEFEIKPHKLWCIER